MSLTSISKHIKVLDRAKLVERSVNGRIHLCRLNKESLSQATECFMKSPGTIVSIFWKVNYSKQKIKNINLHKGVNV
ncbi:ArsR/SmtB family transcription factor [Lysinibacillus sp. FSL M8-0134]|uniref:ArsR/SmtB family transcription factor n=1 Tax=Lysinibacillus sp. FSL M8-0134 TaxID=2921717 RepID=UPI003119C265